MRDGQDRVKLVSVMLPPRDIAALDAEVARRTRTDGEHYTRSRLIREQLHFAPWWPRGEEG